MSFDLQPTIVGERFAVRPLRRDDHDALFEAARDPLIWEQHPDARYKPERFAIYFEGRLACGGALLVTDPKTDEVIGCTSFCDYDAADSSVEIGYTFLVRSRWGGPTNTAIKRALLQHAFQFVDTVWFMVDPKNFRSQRAVEKIGGVRQAPGTNKDGLPRERFSVKKADFA